MSATICPIWTRLINADAVRNLIEHSYREGFRDGTDHGNLEYKYPPEDIAWRYFKKNHNDYFVCLSRGELKQIAAWEDASYDQRTDAGRWDLDAEESAAEVEP